MGVVATLQPGAQQRPDAKYKVMEIQDLKIEEGAHELASSPEMQPYMKLAEAVVMGSDPTAELEAIRQLPVEKRLHLASGVGLEVGLRRLRDRERHRR